MLALATVLAAACGSNSGGQSGGALPTLSYAGATGMVDDVGTAMRVSPTMLASNGAALTACGVKPGSANASAFPGTLSVDASTCVISGTPTAPLPATQFTLMATNSAGTSADATVTLTIHAGWLKQMGVAFQYSLATGVAVDASGNSYVAGYTTGGMYRNTQTGIDDCFIAKYDATGTLTWLKQLGVASKTSFATGVAVDASGNSYVAGFTNGGLDGNPQIGNQDYFIAKYDATGTLIWLKQLGVASKTSFAKGVAVDASGNSYVAGFTTGGLDGNTQTGIDDFFIARYDATGTLTWLKQLGVASQTSYAQGVAVDASGNSYVAGYTAGGLDGNRQIGNQDYFIAKYDATGTLTWLKQLGVASQTSYAQGVAVDASGNSYVAGYTAGGLDGNPQIGNQDYFIAKYDATGTLTWLKQLGVASQTSYAQGVAVDASRNSYVAGYTAGGLDGNTQTGIDDYFIAKYDATGTITWLKQLGVASKTSYAQGVAVDASGNSYVAGSTNGGLDGYTHTAIDDYFIANYNSSGDR